MKNFKQTPHKPLGPETELVTGHFREKAGYAARRDRGTADFLLVYTIGGQGRFGYDTGELIARPGDVVLLRPGAPHDYGVEPELQKWELLWTHFLPRAHWHGWLNWPEFAPGAMLLKIGDLATRQRLVTRLKDMLRHSTGLLRARGHFAMNALEEVLLLCDTQNPLGGRSRLDPRMHAVVDHICRNLAVKLDLETLAGVSGLSVSRMAHLFRAQVGATPQRFIEQQRLNRAMQLLAFTPHSVKAIAYELGFDSPFYFSLRFKRHTGFSPRAYREKAGK
jgi:AraC family transcriptional regulator of arabinose operon